MSSIFKAFVVLGMICVVGCKSQVNEVPEPSPEYLKLSGGTLTGPLAIPQDSFSIGEDQFVAANGNIGIGTHNPTSPLTVNGHIEFLSGGMRFSDGTVQVSAATECFGSICPGDTEFSGKATFTRAPDGASSTDAGVLIEPSAVATNDILFSIVVAGLNLFSADAEGDVYIAGSLTVMGQLILNNPLNCVSCVGSTALIDGDVQLDDLATGSVNDSKIVNNTITGGKLANSTITGIKIADDTIASTKLIDSGVTAGAYGSASLIPVVTVNAKGLISNLSTVSLGSVAASGPAGGDLTGNYPNPTITTDAVGSSEIIDGSIEGGDIKNNALTLSHFASGANNSILGTSNTGTLEWQNPKLQYGIKFEYINSSSLRLVPSGINNAASVLVSNGTDLKAVTLLSPLTASLNSSGAGGLDTGSEAAFMGYDVYMITLADGSSPALLLTISGNTPILPGSYTHKSEVLWFVSNTQGGSYTDIARFVDLGNGRCVYLVNKGLHVLVDGEDVSVTAVDFTATIPFSAVTTTVWAEASNLDLITLTHLRLYYDSAGTLLASSLDSLLNVLGLGVLPRRSLHLSIPLHNGLAGSLFYSFSSLPLIGNFGADIFVQEWTLASRMAR